MLGEMASEKGQLGWCGEGVRGGTQDPRSVAMKEK
jgi:hypothetical protein